MLSLALVLGCIWTGWPAWLVASEVPAGGDRPPVDSGAPAEPEDEALEGGFLDSITVSATRGERPVGEVTGSVTVIDREAIERGLMSDSGDLVRYVPGVYVSRTEPRYGSGGFNIRGVGGNRVLTQIDGVETLEEFEFGHFEVPAFSADLSTVSSVEILRGGASSLYGSDALGGVVSLVTRDPSSYLAGETFHLGARLSYSGADQGFGTGVSFARRAGRWQLSLSAARREGGEVRNQGEIAGSGPARTVPDPLRRDSTQILAKAVYDVSPSNSLKLSVEGFDRSTTTDLLSQQEVIDLALILGFPPGVVYEVDKEDSRAADEQRRMRVSLEQNLQTSGVLGTVLWRLYEQSGDTDQTTRELRLTEFGGGFLGPVQETEILRTGLLAFEQSSLGGEIQFSKGLFSGASEHLLTFGLTARNDRFDQLRDRQESDLDSGEPLPPTDGLVYPTKYFPRSDVTELGAYLQAEMSLADGRLTVVPGVRFDSYDLDADQQDPIYHAGNPDTLEPVDVRTSATSPKLGVLWAVGAGLGLHAQYSHGFRAPPYSAVNSGFTHFSGGITRLPNPELEPETSDGMELGLRGSYRAGSFSLTGFRNDYDNFIELVPLGFNPVTGMIEFQHRNIAQARISGIEAEGELLLGSRWSARGAWSWIRGDDRTRDQPLNSIPPSELVLGLRHVGADGRWGGEIVGRFVAGKSPSQVDDSAGDQFRPSRYETVDLTGHYDLGERVSIQAGVFNLLDQKYWEWAAVLGRESGDPTLDRYTAPGVHGSVAVQFRW